MNKVKNDKEKSFDAKRTFNGMFDLVWLFKFDKQR